MKRDELLKDRGYWIAKIQIDIFHELKGFMEKNNMNKTKLSKYLGFTKGYISQILNGDFDYRISKLVDLSLAIGKVPDLKFEDLEEFIIEDNAKYFKPSLRITCRKQSDIRKDKTTNLNKEISINFNTQSQLVANSKFS